VVAESGLRRDGVSRIMNQIDQVVYINLDERVDRNTQVQQELRCFPPEKVRRFAAIRNDRGLVGCVQSHIAVLELAKREGWRNVLIVEDDMVWTAFNETLLGELLMRSYDVVLLSGTYVRCGADMRLQSAQTTAAYIVAAHYYDTLLENYRRGLYRLVLGGADRHFALDQYWKLLQKKDTWFIAQPVMCIQRPGYSDIEKRVVNYTKAYAK